jgi:streptomycin 6-kinase
MTARPSPGFESYLSRWRLAPDGAPILTATSRLLPVRQGGAAAMLKLFDAPEERFGSGLMAWWDGEGAARVLAIDAGAVLLERAEGSRSLAAMAAGGADAEATAILCRVVARLHAPRSTPWPEAVPLPVWFRALDAADHPHPLARSAGIARALLSEPRDVRLLHGDIHHDNVLDFGSRGWLAIDPKRLVGERAFDYANLFCNPDFADPSLAVARDPAAFAARTALVTAEAGIEADRLLRWIVAWTALSATWLIADGADPTLPLAVGGLALGALGAST